MVDVIALELEDARRRLAAAGLTLGSVTDTRPPQRAELTGVPRVVRLRVSGDVADLVVTAERYVPRAG